MKNGTKSRLMIALIKERRKHRVMMRPMNRRVIEDDDDDEAPKKKSSDPPNDEVANKQLNGDADNEAANKKSSDPLDDEALKKKSSDPPDDEASKDNCPVPRRGTAASGGRTGARSAATGSETGDNPFVWDPGGIHPTNIANGATLLTMAATFAPKDGLFHATGRYHPKRERGPSKKVPKAGPAQHQYRIPWSFLLDVAADQSHCGSQSVTSRFLQFSGMHSLRVAA
jgi:hypothetical protein